MQPDEHKYAVYTPLFAPIAVPMVVGLIKEIKRKSRERKEKKRLEALLRKGAADEGKRLEGPGETVEETGKALAEEPEVVQSDS